MKLTSLIGSTSLLLLSLKVFAVPTRSNNNLLSLRDSNDLIGKHSSSGFITVYNTNTNSFKEQQPFKRDFSSIAERDPDKHDKRDPDKHDKRDPDKHDKRDPDKHDKRDPDKHDKRDESY
jgi:hypothetical protein